MSDYERGPYAPEPPLAFDPRRPVRGAGPVPATLIISVIILAGLIGGVAFIYRGGIRHGTGAPGQVGAPLGDIKAPAPAETPDNSATAGLTIYKTAAPPAGAEAAPILAAPPEQPQPRPGEAGAPGGAGPALAAAGPPPPPPPVAQAAKPAAQPSAIASLTDAAANKPAAKAMTAKPAAKPAAQAAAAPAAPAAGAGWVQIGAFSSAALAEKGWTDIARLEPAAMAGKGKKVEAGEKNGAAIYRTYITGFASKA